MTLQQGDLLGLARLSNSQHTPWYFLPAPQFTPDITPSPELQTRFYHFHSCACLALFLDPGPLHFLVLLKARIGGLRV